jgi:hypothetical protein
MTGAAYTVAFNHACGIEQSARNLCSENMVCFGMAYLSVGL